MMLFHDIAKEIIAPMALYGNDDKTLVVKLNAIARVNDMPYTTQEYYSDDDDKRNSLFWTELINLDMLLDHGEVESFWSGCPVIPETVNIYTDNKARFVECTILWDEIIDAAELGWCLQTLKCEEPDLYLKVKMFLKTEGVEYVF